MTDDEKPPPLPKTEPPPIEPVAEPPPEQTEPTEEDKTGAQPETGQTEAAGGPSEGEPPPDKEDNEVIVIHKST